jgi:predicted N-acetyltransferase YhbS
MITPRFQSPRDITQAEIRSICTLKNQSWSHSMESQLAWWEKNTADDDLFVMLVGVGSILAFLRLRSRTVLVSAAPLGTLCATEVCVEESHRGQGLGMRLMGAAATLIEQKSSGVAYLLCRDVQEPFYAACGWRRTDAPLQIESSSGRERRSLATNERCMTFDPQNRLNGQLILFGDVF